MANSCMLFFFKGVILWWHVCSRLPCDSCCSLQQRKMSRCLASVYVSFIIKRHFYAEDVLLNWELVLCLFMQSSVLRCYNWCLMFLMLLLFPPIIIQHFSLVAVTFSSQSNQSDLVNFWSTEKLFCFTWNIFNSAKLCWICPETETLSFTFMLHINQ